jgi:hypothetical protein
MSEKKKCRLDDDGSPQVVVIEAGEDPQALWVRVGPVYDTVQLNGFEKTVQRKRPGIWIEYQSNHMASDLSGPVLLTPKVWRKLVKAVEEGLEGWE